MKSVTVMSGPAIRQLKNENGRLRLENRRLRNLFDAACDLEAMLTDGGNPDESELRPFRRALAAASEIVSRTTRFAESTSSSGASSSP